MIHCVVLTSAADIYADSKVNYSAYNSPYKFVRNMYNFAWNILD